jgi:hypothetical protein
MWMPICVNEHQFGAQFFSKTITWLDDALFPFPDSSDMISGVDVSGRGETWLFVCS